jgi:cobalt/nickel transport protein
MRTRTLVVGGIVVALLIAGVGSLFASGSPDGLEHVAEQAGFADSAKDSAAKDSPLSDYELRGVENGAVSTGLAGVIGAVVVLLLAGGLAYAVRRKGPPDRARHEPRDSDEPVAHRPAREVE